MSLPYILFFIALVSASTAGPTVNTTAGPVTGTTYAPYPSHVFLGIPYAAPPTGANRFASPQPMTPWGPAPRDATKFGAGCPQVACAIPMPNISCPATYSEDCLFINVFVPQGTPPNAMLPTLLFFHGGNFILGAGGVLSYHGSKLAVEHGVIVVTMNYRLGALGHLFTGPDSISGNFFLQDQRMSMVWVRDNIAAFGGDPSSVTLFGQSAGATSIAGHLTSPKSWGLFSRAIIMSNPWSIPFEDAASSTILADTFLGHLGCPNASDPLHVACVRTKSTADIITAQNATHLTPSSPGQFFRLFMPWSGTVDGTDEMPMQPVLAMATRQIVPVPVVIGTVHDEAVMFIWRAWTKPGLTYLEIEALLVLLFGPNTTAVLLPLYGPPPPSLTDLRYFLANISTDFMFTCPTRYTARSMNEGAPTYVYQYEHMPSFNTWLENGIDPECIGQNGAEYVCHGADLPLLFFPMAAIPAGSGPPQPPTAAEVALSYAHGTYWANFAKTGNPNLPETVPVVWDRVGLTNTTEWLLQLQTPITKTSGYHDAVCDYMDANVGYYRP